MAVENVVSLISSVGFPIVCCIFLWQYVNTTMKDFTEIMNQNTRMIEKLIDRLDRSMKDEEKN